MSKVDELLNGLSEEEIAVYTATPAAEPHIVINEDRSITVPSELKDIAVQFDHNIETVTFDCIRYWDGHDLSDMTIYINYKRADNVLGTYIAENVRVDGDDDTIIHFEWTFSRSATEVKGNLSFLVCAQEIDDEGCEVRHWNSQLCQDLIIREGMDCQTSAVVDQYPDIVTQLLLRMSSVESLPPTVQVIEERDDAYLIVITDINGTHEIRVENGPTFTPSVDDEGNLSWTNNRGLDNPETVNIKGPTGPKGDEIINLLTLGAVKVAIGSTEAWDAYTGDKTDVLFIPTDDDTIDKINETLNKLNEDIEKTSEKYTLYQHVVHITFNKSSSLYSAGMTHAIISIINNDSTMFDTIPKLYTFLSKYGFDGYPVSGFTFSDFNDDLKVKIYPLLKVFVDSKGNWGYTDVLYFAYTDCMSTVDPTTLPNQKMGYQYTDTRSVPALEIEDTVTQISGVM